GHDSIAGFRIEESGAKLTSLGQTATEKTPRSFDIDPSGQFLYAAGESSGKLAAYRIDDKGGLSRFATYDAGAMPWWVLAVPMPEVRETPAELLARAKTVLAPLDGDLALPGLREAVEVMRDRWGVAHIYAKNTHDLFLIQGFVAAQDRLFQIDLWRRQSRGEMSEVFGPRFIAAGRFARLMKDRGSMDAEWKS